MAWIENFDSRQWDVNRDPLKTTVDLHFTATGSESDTIIRNTVFANAPRMWHGFHFQSYSIDHQGGGVWDVTVHYGLSDPAESTLSFDTTGASTHITQSLTTVNTYGNAPDLDGAIGWDGDHVQGTDVQIQQYAWNETHTIAAPLFTAAYKAILYDLTSKTNDNGFRGFSVGEVQFQGARGAQRGNHDVEVTYFFEASPNLSSHTVGSITGIAKKGFEYLWVRYKNTEDATTKRIKAEPDGVYVEQIFEEGDFSLLGIGVV